MRKDAFGVIFVCSERSVDHVRELEQLYDYFVIQPKLEPKNCVVFQYEPEKIKGSDTPKNPICETERIN